jgi:DNA-binding NtrC family response regulator
LPASSRVKNGIIVVAADNRQVRAVIATALRRAGHVVLEAPDSVVMSDIADRYLADLRLCIVDATSPDSPAMVALGLVRTCKPGVAVVLLSDSAETPTALSTAEVHVVVKPFQVAQLVDLAGRILNPPLEATLATPTESPH